jgi:hypothetical protein
MEDFAGSGRRERAMNFVIVDNSKAIHRDVLVRYAAAQQRQLREHFAACYDGAGCDDEVIVFDPAHPAPAGAIQILLHPIAPVASDNALGVHDRAPTGTPTIDVYLDLIARSGDRWESVASHEVLETRADPRLHACVELDDGTIWDREICDRVEAESYEVDGVPLSNFNTPECFEPPQGHTKRAGSIDDLTRLIMTLPEPARTRAVEATKDSGRICVYDGRLYISYDWMGLSTRPNEIRSGGYAQQYNPRRGWTSHGAMRSYRQELATRGLSRAATRRSRSAHGALAAGSRHLPE